MATFVLGKDAKLYRGVAAAALGSLSLMLGIKDVTITMDADEADVTTRDNSGWKATAPTLRQCTAEWEQVWRPGDESFVAVRDAFLSGGLLELAILDQARDVTGAQGPKGRFGITGFSRKEPLGEAITVAVTAKMSEFDEWVEV